MASAILTSATGPLATTSHSRQNHLNQQQVLSSTGGAYEDQDSNSLLSPDISFAMSQGSQGNSLMMQPRPISQYDGGSFVRHRDVAPQIYSAVYSGVDVYEMEVNGIAVMRRRKDSWLNATQILKVAGIEKGKRTKVLEKEILIGEHEKVQGGYGKYQGTWIKFDRGLEFCRQYGVEELLRPLLTYDMGQDGGVAGRGGIDTPTKEQAMAAQRKRLYNNSGSDLRANGQSGTFFKNISTTASHAVAAISKARFDSPGPRVRNSNSARPPSFSRQSSQQLGSQESGFPGGSQQSVQSFVSADNFSGVNGQQDSAYATQQSGPHFSHQRETSRDGDFQEPPRKRIRSSPTLNEMQQSMNEGYYDLSMREASPTEPNESFVYHQPDMVANEGSPIPVPPLPMPASPSDLSKKALLMSLFMDPSRTDFSNHEVFRTLSPQDLDMPIDPSAHTALHWASTLARLSLVKTLIAHGASIFRVNRGGETALMRACVVTNNLDVGGFPDLLELLGPTIELRDSRGRTVLHHIAITSAVKGRSQASKYYLESLLEFVVRKGSAPSSQQSLQDGLRSMGIGRFISEIVNLQDKSGDTALNIAARIGNRSIISQLIEVGADPSISNRSHLCPMDFGIGDPSNVENRISGNYGTGKNQNKDERESSGDIISSITTLLAETEGEFSREMESKQATIDSIHSKLREASAQLGEERRRLDSLLERTKALEERKLKISNLKRAVEEERAQLSNLQQQQSISNGAPMNLGDADQLLALPAAIPTNILSSISLSSTQQPHTPAVLDQAHRHLLASLPSPAVLRARVGAYKANNAALKDKVQALESESTELATKYRKIISLCTRVEETNIDDVLENLLRAVESETNDVELGRVREFLARVEGGE
ncbi:hypothetical protein F5884DRAFT_677166 [Xylogone sp. PMI_703]|nr:hypothetical protein F5884DRAFT_677166 [Xylogone sp. PMI_703]